MPGIINFETFLLTGIFLNLTPGNDTIFILSRSVAYGKKAGLASVLGISTGSLVHTSLAACGLSIIISQSILLFNIVKYAGVAYLFYMGIRMFTQKEHLNLYQTIQESRINLRKIYRDAVLTNVLNPKVGMFFIAFLPQFIEPGYKNTILPFFVLGIVFTITGTIWCSILTIFSASIFSRLRNNQSLSRYLNRVCGIVLIGLGIKLAITARK